MSKLPEFTAPDAHWADGRAQSRAPSTSRGPVVVLKGWRKGMDKAAVTLLLRDTGVSLSEAHEATNRILGGDTASVHLPSGTDVQRVRHRLDDLGVVL